jgi:hypothetical protein
LGSNYAVRPAIDQRPLFALDRSAASLIQPTSVV